jgi:predicted RNA binding protein YcfA (HicA-like mRNA interferase family)
MEAVTNCFRQDKLSKSHLIMQNTQKKNIIPVPMHAKDIKHGLMKAIVKQAESTEEELIRLR